MAFIPVPSNLCKALAKNEDAANAFSMLTPDQKKVIIDRAGRTRTKLGMYRIITRLAKEDRIQ